MIPKLATLDRFLAIAERSIGLIDRCRPIGASAELARTVDAWRSGRQAVPSFRHRPSPDLSELREALATLVGTLGDAGEWGALYAARASELALEAELVESIGSKRFAGLACRRFNVPDDEHASRADERAATWASLQVEEEEPRVMSHDASDPRSLLSSMQRAVGELRLPMRVVINDDLGSIAAVGEGAVYVKAGVPLGPTDVRRLVVHEIRGHALPRFRAQSECVGLFRVGTARSGDDEEGRALLLEERAGVMTAGRRRALGWRHVAARAVRGGSDWVEVVRVLRDAGAPLSEAIGVAARVYRGGGLAREIIYLPAMSRVERAFHEEPGLEAWLERGRVSLDAARRLHALGVPPDWFTPRAA